MKPKGNLTHFDFNFNHNPPDEVFDYRRIWVETVLKYSRNKFRPSGCSEVLEGKILTKEEFKDQLTVILFPQTGKIVENWL